MTWVKLGEERVNTDAITRYTTEPAIGTHAPLVTLQYATGWQHSILDPDGALLRALDEACGLTEPITIACSVCGHAVNVRVPMPYGRVDDEGIHIDGWQVR